MAEKWLIVGVSGVTCGGKTTLAKKLNKSFPSSKLFSQDDYFLLVEDERHTWIPKLSHINFDILSSLDMDKMHTDLKEFFSGKVICEDGLMLKSNGEDSESKASNSNEILRTEKTKMKTLKNDKTTNKDSANENSRIKDGSKTNSMIENELIDDISKSIHESKTKEVKNINVSTQKEMNTNNSTKELIKPSILINGETRNEDLETKAIDLFEKAGLRLCIIEGFCIFNYPPVENFCRMKYFFELDYTECQRRRSLRVYDPPDCEGYFEECVWPEYQKQLDEVKNCVENVVYFDGKMANSFETVLSDLINFVL